MALFISSMSAARRHGVYAIERTPPKTIKAAGTGVCALVGQFPWGPRQSKETPAGTKEMLQMYAPAGMSHAGSGYLTMLAKAFPQLKVVRVMDATGTAAAAATLSSAVPTAIIVVTAKYHGTAGNSIICTVSDASDGDANHFNLTVSVSGASGYTEDYFQNCNYSGVGDDSIPTFTTTLLTGSIVKSNSGRPVNGSTTMSTGADGTVSAADYVGTLGAPDLGLSLLEGDRSIRHVFVDDPGNTFRPTVNAGVKAHVDGQGDRVGYINGNSGLTVAQVQTDVASYRSTNVVYVDPWVYIYDDIDGAKTLVPPASFAASVAAQLSPSTSISWKDPEVGKMLTGIVGLEFSRGDGAADLTDSGVATVIEEEDGGYRIEAGVVTIAPSDPSKARLTRTAMGIYIASSITRSIRSAGDAPNVEANQIPLVAAVTKFMDVLKRNAAKDPNHTPHVVDYAIDDIDAVNTQADIDSGQYVIPLQAKTSAGMDKIFLSVQYGGSIVINSAA